jgi:hypothetical protein
VGNHLAVARLVQPGEFGAGQPVPCPQGRAGPRFRSAAQLNRKKAGGADFTPEDPEPFRPASKSDFRSIGSRFCPDCS